MAAASLLTSYALNKPFCQHTSSQAFKVRAQSYGDEGRSHNDDAVDANFGVLRGRIEEVRIKERLERCYICKYGWNYAPGYDYKLKKDMNLLLYFELAGFIGGTFGVICLGGAVFISLLSIVIHFNQ